MCGIYGMVALGSSGLRRPQLLDRMGAALRHRGPDGHGTLMEPCVAFGAERLRIVDPSPAGDQPFTDLGSHLWLVCNGEIYNAATLRSRYRDYPYRSRTDVEAIIPLFLDKGIEGLAALEGMFALALYDFRHRHLVLARDPAGEKPLFYARCGSELWFASEIQALLLPTGAGRTLDTAAARDHLALGYVREPRTLFRDVRKIEAGTAWSYTAGSSPRTVAFDGGPARHGAARHDGRLETLAGLIERAVAKQLITDAPVGVFASGGVDSALLAANAVRSAGRDRVHLFTAGFPERSFDESGAARRLAAHLRVRHTVVPADDASLQEALQTVVRGIAEPIADPALLPTYLLARAARRHVRVVLSGEGADELFGGYPTYLGHRAAGWYRRLPVPLRHGLARGVAALPVSRRKVSYEYLLKRFVAGADASAGQRHVSWFGTGLPDHAFADGAPWANGAAGFPDGEDPVKRAALFDYRTYLRENLLVKIDRATMLCSLEARAPYLDPAIVRYAQDLDPTDLVRGLTTKWALKRVAARRLPRGIVRRRKRGLSVPVARWLNHGLRSEVDRLLAPRRIERRGLLRTDVVRQLLSEHRGGISDHSRALWPLFVLESWMEHWGSEETP